MMLSVMVVGAGAAFSDQSKIKNTEAVDACTALNIIGGYPDGSFKPEGNITRAEVTKMICVALNGGKNPAVSTNTTPTFSDVRTSPSAAWAEGYIESCAAQGIVSGVGGGKFAPNGNVTGVQLAKMLLVSLGYKSENEGFTGNSWATNVNVRAAQKGLYVGLETMDTNAALTRDNAAQMVWNALNAYEVEYKTTLVTDSKGQLTSQVTVQDKVSGVNNKTKTTLLEDKYEAVKEEAGILLVCKKVDGKDYYTITTSEKTSSGKNVTYNKVYSDVSGLIGQKVQVLHKVTDTENLVYGVYPDEDSKVVATVAAGKLDTVNDSAKVKIDGTEYKLDGTRSAVSGANHVSVYEYNTVNEMKNSLDALISDSSARPYTTKLIDNDGNGKIDAAVVTPISVGEVTYAGSTSISVKVNGSTNSYKFDDADIYSGVAKDDWAVIVKATNSVSDKATITKAEVVNAKAEATRTASGAVTEVKANGTWYKVMSGVTAETNSTYDFVIVNGYIYDADETAASSKDILYVSGQDAAGVDVNYDSTGTLEVKAYFMDGTSNTIKVAKIDGLKLTDNSSKASSTAASLKSDATLVGKLFTYSVNSSKEYELKELANATGTSSIIEYKPAGSVVAAPVTKNLAGYSDVNASAKYAGSTNKMGGKTFADDAVVFVQSKDGTKIVSGKTVKDWASTTFNNVTGTILTKDSNGINYVRVACLRDTSKDEPNAAGDLKYAYLTEDPAQITLKNGDKKMQYIAWDGTELTLTEDATSSSYASGDVIAYRMDGSDIEIDATASNSIKALPVAIVGYNGNDKEAKLVVTANAFTAQMVTDGIVTSAGAHANVDIDADEDAAFIAIDDSETAGHEGGKSAVPTAKEETINGTTYVTANAYLYYDKEDKNVKAIVYDVDNELKNAPKFNKASGALYTAPTAVSSIAVRNLTAPSNGGTPVTTATVSNARVTVAWTPAATTFAASTVYTARVTVTANTGYCFADTISASSITGAGGTVSNVNVATNGTSVTFDVTFAATGA